jgi:hypothetical protein
MKSLPSLAIIVILLMGIILSACASPSTPSGAVEAYYQGLVEKDRQKLVASSCSDWEASAQFELVAFEAVDIELKEIQCQPTGEDGKYTLVSCTGELIANYEDQAQTLDLNQFTYQVIEEGGEWRMCGYR